MARRIIYTNKSGRQKLKKNIDTMFKQMDPGNKDNFVNSRRFTISLLRIMTKIARQNIPAETTYEYRKNFDIISEKKNFTGKMTESEAEQQGPDDYVLHSGKVVRIRETKRGGQVTFTFAHEYGQNTGGDDDFSKVLSWINGGRKSAGPIGATFGRNNSSGWTVQSRSLPSGIFFRKNAPGDTAQSLNALAGAMWEQNTGEKKGTNWLGKAGDGLQKSVKKNAIKEIRRAILKF